MKKIDKDFMFDILRAVVAIHIFVTLITSIDLYCNRVYHMETPLWLIYLVFAILAGATWISI